MALQSVSSSTASAESYLNTLSEVDRGQVEFALLPNQPGSSQSSSKLTHKTQPSASNVEVIALSSSDSEDENDAPSTSGITEPVDNETPPVAGPSNRTRKMICHRCPTEKIGAFTNEEKFRIHIKRHLYGDVFQCATCHRPFTKISFCISHKIRVHGTKLNYNNRDGVIAYAKRYVEERAAKRAAKRARGRGPISSTSTSWNLVDEETDDEDPKFYNNQIVASTGLTKYRGPPVNSLLEAYETQVTHSRHRSKNACDIAQKALDTHLENVENKFDTYKLKQCPFSKKTNGAATKRKRAARRS